MKNEKFCFNKGTGLVALIGIVLVSFVLASQMLAGTKTSTNSRAFISKKTSNTTSLYIYKNREICENNGCTKCEKATDSNFYKGTSCTGLPTPINTPTPVSIQQRDISISVQNNGATSGPTRTIDIVVKKDKDDMGTKYSIDLSLESYPDDLSFDVCAISTNSFQNAKFERKIADFDKNLLMTVYNEVKFIVQTSINNNKSITVSLSNSENGTEFYKTTLDKPKNYEISEVSVIAYDKEQVQKANYIPISFLCFHK